MDGNSLYLALFLVVLNLFCIFFLNKHKKENAKKISHYEAIADEHIKKLYKPIEEKIIEIIGLLIAGYFLPIIVFIIVYAFWHLLKNIQLRQIVIMSNQEILMLKNGLINMSFDYNQFSESYKYKVEIEDYYPMGEFEPSQQYKTIVIKKEKKEIYSYLIDIDGLTSEQIEDLKIYHQKRFRDYLRYIPKEVFNNDNTQELLDDWFTYLDDVRANY